MKVITSQEYVHRLEIISFKLAKPFSNINEYLILLKNTVNAGHARMALKQS